MGSFAANAVGFFLSLQDDLTPALDAAEGRYVTFVKKIASWNEAATKTIKSGMSALTEFIEGIGEADKALGAVLDKPLSKKVHLTFEAKEANLFALHVSKAVAKVLSKVKFNIVANKGSKGGMIGTLANLPKFARGGIIPRNPNSPDPPGVDDQIAAVQSGEMIVPRSGVSALDDMDRLLSRGMASLNDGVAELHRIEGHLSSVPLADAPGPAAYDVASSPISRMASIPLAGGPAAAAPYGVVGAAPPPLPPSFEDTLRAQIGAVTDAQTAFKDLRAGFDLGVVSADALQASQKRLVDVQNSLDAAVKHYDYRTLRPFVHDLDDTKKSTRDLTEAVKGDDSAWTKLLKEVLGPARFLAVNKALGSLQSGISHLSEAAHAGFGNSAQKIDDFVTNFNQINKMAGLTREELRKVKEEAADSVSAFGGAFDLSEFSESFQSLRQTGLSDLKLIQEMAGPMTAFENATTTSKDTAAGFFNSLHYNTKLAVSDMADLAAGVAKYSKMTGADADKLTSEMKDNVGEMTLFLSGKDAATQKSMLDNFTRFSAALSGESADMGNELSGLIAKAIGGDSDAMQNFNNLAHKAFNQEQLGDMLKTGEGMASVIQNIADNAKQIGPTAFSTTAAGIFPGLDTKSLAGIGTRVDAIVSSFNSMGKEAIGAGKGVGYLTERALADQTAWQTWTKKIGNALGSFHILGVSGTDVADVMKEFGLQNIHSTFYLLRLAGDIPGVSKLLKGMGGVIGELIGKMASLVGLQWGQAAAQEAVAATAATSATALTAEAGATAAAETASAGLGASIASLGAGIGTFLTEVGTGAGAGLAGFLIGMATGFAAFAAPPVIIGTAVIVAAMIGLGFAARVAAPFFEAMAKMDTKQLLAAGPAMGMIGIGFAAMAGGILTGSLLMLAAVPALAALQVVLAVTGIGGGGGLGGVGTMVVNTVNALGQAFSGLDVSRMQTLSPKIAAVATFLSDYAKISAAVTALLPSRFWDAAATFIPWAALVKPIIGAFTGDNADGLSLLKEHSEEIGKAINSLVDATDKWTVSEKLPDAAKKLKPVAEFVSSYTSLANSLISSAPSRSYIGMGKAMLAGTTEQQLKGLVNDSASVKDAFEKLVPYMGSITVAAKSGIAGGVPEGLKNAGLMLHDLSAVTTGMADLGKLLTDRKADLAALGTGADAVASMKAMADVSKAVGAITTVQQINHNVNAPVLTPQQLQQAVSVTVAGRVDSVDMETHALLREISDRLAQRGTTPATASRPPVSSPATLAFGQGRIG